MNLLHLLDDAKCFEVIRAHRWPDGVRCPSVPCTSPSRPVQRTASRVGRC
ncbi:transposase [Deinococcus sp. UYEF24]